MERRLTIMATLAVATAVAIGAVIYRPVPMNPAPNAAQAGGTPTAPPAVVSLAPATDGPIPRGLESTTAAGYLPEPFRDFFTWTHRQQLDAVTRMESDPRLDAAIIAFFLRAVEDRRLDAVTRNNIANALLAQELPDPALAPLFTRMIHDPAESLQWREYAVQHLAGTVGSRPDPESIIADLKDLVRHGPDSLPGTALIALHRLEGQGQVMLDDAFLAEAAQLLESPTAHPMTRMAVLSVLGERHLVAYAQLIRTYAQSEQPSLRRVAIAQLGILADPADRPVIEHHLHDGDPLVVLAARSALAALDRSGRAHPP